MYVMPNFKTKKQLKEAVSKGDLVMLVDPSPFASPYATRGGPAGELSVEGPHYPAPHAWHARVKVKDGVVVKVIG